MNILKVDFPELYERHLCRHSQFGINVIHLATVVGSYLGLFAIAGQWVEPTWLLSLVPVPYLVLLAFNVPFRVQAASLMFVALFFALFFALPALPIWLSLVLIVLSHQVQNWSHRIYTTERDMTEFNKKYKKGPALFVLLTIYELPILLNYLICDSRNWLATAVEPEASATPTPAASEQAPSAV